MATRGIRRGGFALPPAAGLRRAAELRSTKSSPPERRSECWLRHEYRAKLIGEACTPYYLKLTEACHAKAKRKNKIGIIGNTSTIGSKGAYASGRRPRIKREDEIINSYIV